MQRKTDHTPSMAPETTTFLEMTSPQQLRPGNAVALIIVQLSAADWEVGRKLYIEVGKPWQWLDRLSWSDADWRARYAGAGVELWTGSVGGDVVGYFELYTDKGSTEVAYFGLRPDYIGRGFGGTLLTLAVKRAWATGCRRVWVHTSDRDHPVALANYIARGFSIYATERKFTPVMACVPSARPRM